MTTREMMKKHNITYIHIGIFEPCKSGTEGVCVTYHVGDDDEFRYMDVEDLDNLDSAFTDVLKTEK